MAEVSSIRQAFNKVYITGILEEKDIKIEQTSLQRRAHRMECLLVTKPLWMNI